MKHNRIFIGIIGTMALASLMTTSAFAQMGGGGMMGGFGSGGGMMGGFGSGDGMMGGFGSRGGGGTSMMGGYGADSRNDNGYAPGTNGDRRRAPLAPGANGSAPSGDPQLGPLNQLDLSRQQLGAINIISQELRDRQSNLNRRLAAEREKLRALYDAPERDRTKIDRQFRRIAQLRREMFESSVDAHDRIEAQLNAQQQQRLRRIAPRWSAGG